MGVTGSNQIDLIVSERGVTEVSVKVIVLAEASERAEGTLGRLKSALDGIRGGGLTSLVSSLQGASASTQALKSSTDGLTASQRAGTDASRASAEAKQVESQSIRGLIGTKAELREIERTIAAESRAASAAAKVALREEAQARQQVISEVLAERTANDALSAAKLKQTIETERQIAIEQELGRARELSSLKTDIQQRNPPISAKQVASEEQATAQAAIVAQNAELIAQYNALSEVEQAEIATQTAEIDSTDILAAAYRQIAEAQLEVSSAKAAYRDIQSAINDGWLAEGEAIQYSATAMQRNVEASEQLIGAQTNLAEVQSYLNAETVVSINVNAEAAASETALATAQRERIAGLARLTALQTEETLATASNVSATVGASASLGLLEGRTMSMTRAAAQFLTKILPFGEIIQAAFPVIGAIALIAVVDMAYNAFEKFETKLKALPETIATEWQKATDSVITASLATETEVDKMQDQIDKLMHRSGENGLVVQFDEAAEAANRLGVEIDKDVDKTNELIKKSQVSFWQKLAGAGSTDDLSKQLTGFNTQIANVKKEYQGVYDSINSDPSYSAKDRTNQIVANQEREMVALEKVYSDADTYLTPKIKNLREQMKDFNDPARKALGVNGSDPSTQLSLAVGAKGFFDADQTQLGTQYRKDQLTPKLETARIEHNNAGDEAKAVRENWNAATQAFKDYQGEVAKTGTNATAAQDQAWWEKEISKLLTPNKPKGRDEVSKYSEQQNTQQHFVDDQIAKMADKVAGLSKYDDALRENKELERFEQEAQAKGIVLTQAQIDKYKNLSEAYSEGRPLQETLNSMTKAATDAEEKHALVLQASAIIMHDHPELSAKITEAVNKETEAWENANNHLRQYNASLNDQAAVAALHGQEASVTQQLIALQRQQTAEGHALTTTQLAIEGAKIIALQDEAIYQKALGDIYADNTDKLRILAIQQQANSDSYKNGHESKDVYQANSVQNQAQQNEISNKNGQGGKSDILVNSLAEYQKNFKGFAAGVKDTMSQMWKSIGDGAANAFSKWIVYGGNLSKAMKGLAQEIAQGILSSLIKLGIQTTLNWALESSIDAARKTRQAASAAASAGILAASTAASIAAGVAVAAAWSPAALVTSIGSFGAADAAASAGIAATSGVLAAAMIPKFATGGFVSGPGTGTSDSIMAMLSNGEYVLSASTTAQIGRANLDAVQAGARSVGANSPGVGGGGLTVGSKSTKFTIEDHTSGVKWQTIPIGEDEMRVIARDEGKNAVYRHADEVISQQMANGNSKTRKATHQYTTARPQR